jgi:hypothetical protein
MLTGIIALAILALIATQGKSGASPMESPAVKSDLARLQAANPTAYTTALAWIKENNPVRLIQGAAQMLKDYPALAQLMGNMAAAAVVAVTGASGTSWNMWGTHAATGDLSTVYVLLGGMPVIWYSQAGSDKTSRKFLGAQPGIDTATIARARSDFGV